MLSNNFIFYRLTKYFRPQNLENSICEEKSERPQWKYINETFSLNESKDSIDNQNKYDMLNDFMTPIEGKSKVIVKEGNAMPQLNMEMLNNLMSSDSK